MKVTQSIVKRFYAYQQGECGEKISQEMRGRQSPPSPAMALGNYFEFLVSGSTGIHNLTPQAVTLKSGELSAPYRVVTAQAERVKAVIEEMGVKIKKVNHYEEKGDLAGHIDLIAEVDGVMSVIDLKYSSNLDDKWTQWGWTWSQIQKDFHSVQAMHYSILTGMPFYYLVAEASDGGKIELFKIEFVNEDRVKKYLEEIEEVKKFVEVFEMGLLAPRPEFNRCSACHLTDCAFRMNRLTIKPVEL